MESILFDIFWYSIESSYLFNSDFSSELKLSWREKHMSEKTSSNSEQKQVSLHLKVHGTRSFPRNFRI